MMMMMMMIGFMYFCLYLYLNLVMLCYVMLCSVIWTSPNPSLRWNSYLLRVKVIVKVNITLRFTVSITCLYLEGAVKNWLTVSLTHDQCKNRCKPFGEVHSTHLSTWFSSGDSMKYQYFCVLIYKKFYKKKLEV